MRKVIFLGTPDFAVLPLKKIAASKHEVLAVVTQPDRPVGRKAVVTPCAVKVAAESLGLTTIQWDVDSLDWKGLSAMEITNRVLNGVRNGSIILCHNNSDHILDALPIMLDRLQKKGYTVSCVGDLILKGDYVIDNNGMQTAKI